MSLTFDLSILSYISIHDNHQIISATNKKREIGYNKNITYIIRYIDPTKFTRNVYEILPVIPHIASFFFEQCFKCIDGFFTRIFQFRLTISNISSNTTPRTKQPITSKKNNIFKEIVFFSPFLFYKFYLSCRFLYAHLS